MRLTRRVRFAGAITVAIVAILGSTQAKAAPRTKVADVCSGCLASVPSNGDQTAAAAPLLVTLHGDWGAMAPELHAAWERFTAPRGVALLSLACPSELGCKRSWWQWNGNPTWITDQIERLAARHPIDHERLWLAGWSGGASYMGMRTQELERTFAALVIHGGGIWPSRADCAPEKAPIVFLAGDQNPLHAHVLKLREHYEHCGNEISFMLLRGAEHTREWSALDKRGGEILDLLGTKRRVAAATPPATPAPPSPSPVAASGASTSTPAPAPLGASPPEPVRPRAGCGCDLAGAAPRSSSWMVAAMFILLASRRAASRSSERSARASSPAPRADAGEDPEARDQPERTHDPVVRSRRGRAA
jgi:poly(3-hydroxybutyrate) depolymerase